MCNVNACNTTPAPSYPLYTCPPPPEPPVGCGCPDQVTLSPAAVNGNVNYGPPGMPMSWQEVVSLCWWGATQLALSPEQARSIFWQLLRGVTGGGPAPDVPAPEGQVAQSTLNVVLESFEDLAGEDGLFSREDLENAASDPDASPELRRACRLLLDNPSLFNALDHAADPEGDLDGLVSRGDTEKVLEQWVGSGNAHEDEEMQALETLGEFMFLVDTAAGVGSRDGKLSRADLEAVLADPDLPPELHEAARYLLEHDHFFESVDTASGGDPDGLISAGDIDRWREENAADKPAEPVEEPAETEVATDTGCEPVEAPAEEPADTGGEPVEAPAEVAEEPATCEPGRERVDAALDVLGTHWDVLGGEDGVASREDLERVLADPDTPPELRQACQMLLDNPALFNAMDSAADCEGTLDGKISSQDLERFEESWTRAQDSNGEPYEVLLDYLFLVDTAAGDGERDAKFSRDDLEAILHNPDLPREVRAAARALLDSPDTFAHADRGGDAEAGTDGIISVQDLLDVTA